MRQRKENTFVRRKNKRHNTVAEGESWRKKRLDRNRRNLKDTCVVVCRHVRNKENYLYTKITNHVLNVEFKFYK